MARLALGLALAVVLSASFTGIATGAPTTITTVAGGGSSTTNGTPATGFQLNAPGSVAPFREQGSFMLTDATCYVRRVDVDPASDTGNISRMIGKTTGSCTPGAPISPGASMNALSTPLGNPCCVVAGAPNIGSDFIGHGFVANTSAGRVEFFTYLDVFTQIGSGTPNCVTNMQPNNVAATSANLCQITGLSVSPDDSSILLVEGGRAGHDVYEVSGGTIHLLNGDLGAPDVHQVAHVPGGDFLETYPLGVRLEAAGGASGTRIAGNNCCPANYGDGGEAQNSDVSDARGVALTYDGGFVFVDSGHCRIRKVAGLTPTSIISTVAGSACGTALGDGGPSTAAQLNAPTGVAMTPSGILIADTANNRIRLVNRTTILSGPTGTVTDSTPTFEIASLDNPAHLKCSLDAGAAVDCPSPFTLPVTSDGPHTLTAWENGPPADPTPSSRSFTIDATGPIAPALREPGDDAAGLPPSPEFSWDATTDAISSVSGYELWIDGVKDHDVPLSACSAGICHATPGTPLSEAAHTWQVKAIDSLGNVSSSATRKLSSGSPPTATFIVNPNPALVGRPVTFNAGASTDLNGPIARYEWDLDGDGSFETDSGASPTIVRSYPAPATIPISLRVTDGVGTQATAAASLRVSEGPAGASLLGVSINNGAQFTRSPNVTLTVKAPATANAFLVSNDGGFFAPITFPVASTVQWRLDSSGPERLPKTIYLRFMLGPIISDNYTDDIILDEVPPVVQTAALVPAPAGKAAARAAAAKTRTYTVKAKAKDSNSGVAKLQVTANKRKPGKLLKYATKLKVKSTSKPKYLRAQDRAGNFSAWKKLR